MFSPKEISGLPPKIELDFCHIPTPLLSKEDMTNIYQPRKSNPHEHNIKMHELKDTQIHTLSPYNGRKIIHSSIQHVHSNS